METFLNTFLFVLVMALGYLGMGAGFIFATGAVVTVGWWTLGITVPVIVLFLTAFLYALDAIEL